MSAQEKWKVYLVPNTHSDLQYRKSYQEYFPVHIGNLKEGLDILAKCPDFRYTTEHVALLEEFWKRFPAYRENIRRFIQEKRLEIRSGAYCLCDVNLPSGESLIQQIHYGKKWTTRHLGAESETAWLADAFGYHQQLPQILRGCGYRSFIFERGVDHPERKSEFWWEGLDKTSILTYWSVRSYDGIGSFSPNKERDFFRLREVIAQLKKHSSFPTIMLGNGGDFALPDAISCERVKDWNQENEEEIILSTPSEYCQELLEKDLALDVFKGDFNPVFQGCYSSRIKLKQKNRSLESRILTLEKIFLLMSLWGNAYPYRKLDRAWKKLLFYQFHDTISGTIVDSAYEEALKGYEEVEDILNDTFESNLNFFKGEIRKQEESSLSKILVFNPLSWERKDLVKVGIEGEDWQVEDENGNLIESQRIVNQDSSFLAFIPTVPSLGYKAFNLTPKKRISTSSFEINGNTIANQFYRIKLSETGVITSLINKENGFEYVDQERPFFNDLAMQDDNGDLWLLYDGPMIDNPGWGRAQDNIKDPMPLKPKFSQTGKRRIGFFIHSKDQLNEVEIIEKGPVRVVVRVVGELPFWTIKVKFTQYIYFYRDLERIDFLVNIFPSGKHYRLKVCFPTSIKKGEIYHEIPFGSVKRPEGEFPAQNWISYGDNEKGLCLMNQGLPGNNVTDRVMMLSLMRSAAMEYKGPSQGAFEEGVPHSFEYSLVPYTQRSFSYLTRKGLEFNTPFVDLALDSVKGDIPLETSFFRTKPDNIVLSSLRKIEDGIVLRVYEAKGERCQGQIEFFRKLKNAERTDLLGRSGKKMRISNGNTLEFTLLPYQIRTFKVSLGDS